MATSYTPGLKVLKKTLFKTKRILPLKGNVHVKIGQNIKYDMTILFNAGNINIYPYHDTMLMSFALDAGKRSGHGMDSLSKTHLNITPISFLKLQEKVKTKLLLIMWI